MKWVMVNNKHNVLHEYRLTDGNDTRAVVKYNPIHRSARITIGDTHRLFFIASAGSLSGKYIFKNEYGIEVGMMSNDKWGKEGSINIESKKYIYKVQNNPLAELTIYDAFTNQPLASCALTTSVKGTSLSLSSQNNGADSHYLLLGLCWFLFLPVAKENVVEYAA
jgi:hypothetical protein